VAQVHLGRRVEQVVFKGVEALAPLELFSAAAAAETRSIRRVDHLFTVAVAVAIIPQASVARQFLEEMEEDLVPSMELFLAAGEANQAV
jgi:hypothetical protein